MSKEKYVLKQMTYDDYIYYNGKCKEGSIQALELKAGKLDYFILFKNKEACNYFFVDVKEKPSIRFYRIMEIFKDNPMVIDELLKIYDEITIKEIELFRDEEIKSLDYIKKYYKVVKEEITDHQILWRNGKKAESADITIRMKENKSDTKIIKGTFEDYVTWLGHFYANENKETTKRIKKGELAFYLILNKDKYLDHLCVDEKDDNKVNLLIHFDTIINNYKQVFKELKKYYKYLSFIIDSSYYKEAYSVLKNNCNIIEEKKIPYTFSGGKTLDIDFIKIKL